MALTTKSRLEPVEQRLLLYLNDQVKDVNVFST